MKQHFIALFAGIVIGAMIVGTAINAQPEKQNQNECKCCKHMIQLAEDVHQINTKLKFDFTPPPDYVDPGPLTPINLDKSPPKRLNIQAPRNPGQPRR